MASPLNCFVTPLVALLPFLAGISVSNIAVAQDGFAAVPSSRHDSSQYGITKSKSKSSAILAGKERTRTPLVKANDSSPDAKSEMRGLPESFKELQRC
jgi:hypothetical protein